MRPMVFAVTALLLAAPASAQIGGESGARDTPGLGGPSSGLSSEGVVGEQRPGGQVSNDGARSGGTPPAGSTTPPGMTGGGSGVPGTATGPDAQGRPVPQPGGSAGDSGPDARRR